MRAGNDQILDERGPLDKDLLDLCEFYGVQGEKAAERRAALDVAAGRLVCVGRVLDTVTKRPVTVWRPKQPPPSLPR